jgi:hypothetical protein
MLGIEERYVERTARAKSTSFVNQLTLVTLLARSASWFGAFQILTHSKSPTDIVGAIFFFAGFPAGLRFSYLGWRVAKRQNELNIR